MSRELLLLVDALAREKNVAKEIVFGALELALASATKKRIHDEAEVRVSIDRSTGNFESFRRWLIVPENEYVNEYLERPLPEAQKDDPEIEAGDYLEEPLEPIDFGRIGAQAAKQVILQKIRDAEREQILPISWNARNTSFSVRSSAWSVATPSSKQWQDRSPAAARSDDPQGKSACWRPCSRLSVAYRPRCAWSANYPVAYGAGICHQAVQSGSAGN
jgi:hypothetical protein